MQQVDLRVGEILAALQPKEDSNLEVVVIRKNNRKGRIIMTKSQIATSTVGAVLIPTYDY
ncbi:hypothetical protein [Paenibacillus sp. FSL R5-0928]|uniref:hypothetical protein n=1 Tax=Paenibacillus sp. FSL R5-0928 TaxID=2921667 RepID=UPI0030DDC534